MRDTNPCKDKDPLDVHVDKELETCSVYGYRTSNELDVKGLTTRLKAILMGMKLNEVFCVVD